MVRFSVGELVRLEDHSGKLMASSRSRQIGRGISSSTTLHRLLYMRKLHKLVGDDSWSHLYAG